MTREKKAMGHSTIHFLGEDSSRSDVRGVRIQNARLLREWEALNQGLLQGIERLLRFLSPFEPCHLTGETGQWLGNGGKPFYKPAIIGGQAKERPNVPKAVGHWPSIIASNLSGSELIPSALHSPLTM